MATEYRGGGVIAATVVSLFFSISAVILRIIARRYQAMKQLPEDYYIYLGLLFKIGIDVGGIILLCNGLGRHITEVGPTQLVTFLKTQITGSFLYTPCIMFVKLSILAQYLRLFANHSRTFKMQIYVLMALVVGWCIAIVIASGFVCQPLEKLWTFDRVIPGKCFNLNKFYYGIQIPNLVTDVLIIVVPIREMIGLELSRKVKVGATLMFLLGIITIVFGSVRLAALVQLSELGPDLTWNETWAAIWTTVEPAAAIVAVCIPSVRTLYRSSRARSRMGDGSYGYGRSKGSNGNSNNGPNGKTPSFIDRWANKLQSSTSSTTERPSQSGNGSKYSRWSGGQGMGGFMKHNGGRPDELPHIDRRLSEESDTGIIEMGMAPGTRGGPMTETGSNGSPFLPGSGFTPAQETYSVYAQGGHHVTDEYSSHYGDSHVGVAR